MVSKWWHEYQVVVEVVIFDGASVAKMSGGDVDVEPYLDSRNTKGYGTATQILKPQSSKSVGERNCPEWLGYAEVVEVCGSISGLWWAPEQNLVKNGRKMGRWMEMLLQGAGCSGGRPDVRVGPDVQVGPDVRALRAGCPGS